MGLNVSVSHLVQVEPSPAGPLRALGPLAIGTGLAAILRVRSSCRLVETAGEP